MGCNPTRANCTADGVFAAVANANCSQFFNPENFQAEQIVYDQAFSDLINNFGIPIDYYVHTYNLSAADNFYGEHPTSVFYGPVSIMMYVELSENAISLSRFGFASDDELTGYVHIKTFESSMSGNKFYVQTPSGELVVYDDYVKDIQTEGRQNIMTELLQNLITVRATPFIEPKSGDLIQLSPLGCDRPNGRGAKVFEITERTDQDIASLNPLLGHYIYRLKAKRYEYSFEPGAPKEPQNQQVFENSFSGILSSNIPEAPVSDPKAYNEDIDNISQTEVLNMNVNNTDIYGSYY